MTTTNRLKGASRRTIASYSTRGHAPRHLLHRAEPRAHDRAALHGEAVVGEPVDGALGLRVGRAAGIGAAQGALIGALFALLFGVFFTGPEFVELLLYALALGALFGALYGALAQYATSGGKRDFVSAPSIQADRYDVQVDEEAADEATRVLRGMPGAR